MELRTIELKKEEIAMLTNWGTISLKVMEGANSGALRDMGGNNPTQLVHPIIERWIEKPDMEYSDAIVDPHLAQCIEGIVARVADKEGWDGFYIYRSVINVTFPSDITGELICNPHIDHWCEHSMMLLYLKTSTGDTLLYEEIPPESRVKQDWVEELPRLSKESTDPFIRIKPRAGRAIIIRDGFIIHTAEPPDTGYRAVCVVTFAERKRKKYPKYHITNV